MNKLPLVIWLLGWPLLDEIVDYLAFKRGKPAKETKPEVGFLMLAIWVGVAILVYP